MADSRANLKVKIGGDIAEIKSALASLRGDLAKTKKDAASTNVNGLASSLKSLAGTVLGIGAVGLAIRGIYRATVEAEKAQAQLNAVLKSTGGAAGLNAKELNKMAEGLQAVTTFDDEAITGAQSLLLTFTSIGKDIFPQATKAILDMSVAMGQDLSSTAVQVGKALQDPINGITALKRVGVNFSDAQKEVIKNLVETGKAAEAQKLILKELQVEFGGSAEAARNTLGGALEGLKNDFENLLEGDSGGGGTRGVIDSINELSKTMQSPEVKAGFSTMISGLVSIIEFTAKGMTAIVGLGQAVKDSISLDKNKTYIGLLTKRAALESDIYNARPGLNRFNLISGGESGEAFSGIAGMKAKLVEIDQLINARRAIDTATATPFKGLGVFKKEAAARGANSPEVATATTTATAVASARASVEAKAAADRKAAAEKEAKAIEDRNQRIVDGMADVNIELLRQTGQAAEASFAEIDAKYAKLLADLQAKGDKEGEATLRKLIGLEKADVVLEDLRSKIQAAKDGLRGETEFISNQVGIPGGITPVAAEQQLQAAREKTLAQLIDLQKQAQAAYNAKPTPETLAALREATTAVNELQKSTNKYRQEVEQNLAANLETFFLDLASGAKSFKDAFKDMVRSFLAGIAQMIAQDLALKAAKSIVGLFHTGGVVGATPNMSRAISPMAFIGAPRFHDGGIAGLKAGEVPAILQTGERVLSRKETARYSAGDRPAPGVRIINTMDPSAITDVMESAAGEKVIFNVIGRNPGRIQSLLR